MGFKLGQDFLDKIRGKRDKADGNMPIKTSYLTNEYQALRSAINSRCLAETAIGGSDAQIQWSENEKRVKHLILNDDIENFLNWDVIRNTMFVDSNAEYILTELNVLKSADKKYLAAVREDIVGKPAPCKFYPAASSNLIHHVYSVNQFETRARKSVREMDFILEFGGGYGSMCRAIHNLGFNGLYIIFDLYCFSCLQKYFLQTLGFPVFNLPSNAHTNNKGILCISSIDELKMILADYGLGNNSLFIATWSFSETALGFREQFMPFLTKINHFLIAYQNQFKEVDNIEYFQLLTKKYGPIIWENYAIEHLCGSHYLIGSTPY